MAKTSFYLDITAKTLFFLAMLVLGWRVEIMIEYNKQEIQENQSLIVSNSKIHKANLELNQKQVKLLEEIKGKIK
jgi:hypothetical protein